MIIAMKIYSRKIYIDSFNNDIQEGNCVGAIIINPDKDNSKCDYCIYLKDFQIGNAVHIGKKPIVFVMFYIDNNSKLQVRKMDKWTYNKMVDFYNEIDYLEKYDQNGDNYIKIRNNNSEYYVDMLSLNPIMYEYFFVNLNVPTDYLLK